LRLAPVGRILLATATVLVVDDHPTFRRFARRLVRAAGFAVIGEAADGASAVAAARELRPDVVLLDVLLPDMTGFEVVERLAADPAGPRVVLTSSRSASDTARARAVERARVRLRGRPHGRPCRRAGGDVVRAVRLIVWAFGLVLCGVLLAAAIRHDVLP
jgi:CheY-like chemotaxis protein